MKSWGKLNLVWNLEGLWIRVNKISIFLGKFLKNFFRQICENFDFFLANFWKISISSGNLKNLGFQAKIAHFQLLLSKLFYFSSKVTTFEHTFTSYTWQDIIIFHDPSTTPYDPTYDPLSPKSGGSRPPNPPGLTPMIIHTVPFDFISFSWITHGMKTDILMTGFDMARLTKQVS